ncbi:MAG TPA: alkaline phosphatase family protein, partial [Acidimicrobiia bacterium]|nr:alkaline phosphatase family protein [Acidimicrobiia bacterium]
FDAYHCSTLTSTYPNREYMHSAQSGGITNNVLPPEVGSGADRPYLHGFTWDTIWDRLQTVGNMIPGKDAAYFFVDLPAIALWGERMIPFAQHIEDYFARAASGTLPRVVFLDPGFTTGLRTDDHPYADIRAGQKLVTDLVKAFVDSPHWGRGAFFITYDEWGGFFDHVAPPTLPDNLAGYTPPGLNPPGFEQAGFRVPTIMVSPHCQKGTVDHHLYDHTSILRFIEWRYLGAPAETTTSYTDPDSLPSWALTLRDANAFNIGASLVAGSDPDFETPLLPEVPVTSLPCEGEELEGTGAPVSGVPVSSSALPDLSESHAFEHALNQGFFEQMGFTIDLRKKVPSL